MPTRNTTHYTVEQGWKRWGADAEERMLRGLAEVTAVMVEAARAAEVRQASKALHDSIGPGIPARTPKGMQGGIGATDFKAVWYELGTSARRSKAIMHSGNRGTMAANAREAKRKEMKKAGSKAGVVGLHYLRKGLAAGRGAAFEMIGKSMRDAKSGLEQ